MRRNKNSGFTLVELLITIAIVGILTAVAGSMYSDNVLRSNRTEARSALQQAAGTLEKCKSLYGSYNNANCNYADFTSESGLYDISENGSITDSVFVLTAAPAPGSRLNADDDCATLSLSNTGLKTATGNNPPECW